MVRDVEDLEANRRVVSEHAKPLGDLRVERHEGRESPDAVSRPDKVTVAVDVRDREPRPGVEHRKEGEPVRQRQAGPDEHTIRRIPGERPALVRANDGILDVPEEAVEVVEIADGGRARVRRDNPVVAVKRVAPRDLRFAIA